MPVPIDENDYRNQVAESLMQPPVAPNTALSRATQAIPQNLGRSFTTGMPAGMPQTPVGGVPGSGMAPAGPSTVQLPQAPRPMSAPMQSMGATPPQLGSIGQPLPLPTQQPMDTYGLSEAPGLPTVTAPRTGRRPRGY